ncbi:MAG: hypothetical protein PUF77_00475 [Clostridiales bacterium]|nr:hypothetical protein [Clostridiales bacterium]
MDKIKRIVAMIAVVILAGLYGATLFFAITDNTATMRMFSLSVVATVIIPVFMYIYMLIYRRMKDDVSANSMDGSDSSDEK